MSVFDDQQQWSLTRLILDPVRGFPRRRRDMTDDLSVGVQRAQLGPATATDRHNSMTPPRHVVAEFKKQSRLPYAGLTGDQRERS
jgi:hypothetical protein